MNVSCQPQQTYTIPNNATLPLYATQQTSPADSMPPTPSDTSPTSPRLHQYLQYRQPNQYKQIKEPRTPSTSLPLHGSLDSLEAHHQGDTVDDPQQLDPVLENDYFPEEELGDVTGPPTKEHWKPDSASPTCDSPTCRSTFSLFTRKHHCRHCGHIFCAPHTSHSILLNQHAAFHPDGFPSKACETCSRQFRLWSSVRRRRESAGPTESVQGQGHQRTQSHQVGNTQMHAHHQRGGSAGVAMMKGSVLKPGLGGRLGVPTGTGVTGSSAPKDWMWSTF